MEQEIDTDEGLGPVKPKQEVPLPKKRPRLKRSKNARAKSRDENRSTLRDLACFDQIHRHLCEGWALAEVATWIHETAQEALDVSHEALVHRLHLYRQSIPPVQLAERRISTVAHDARRAVEEGLDELREMENLYRLQLKRINIDFAMEEKMRILRPSMTQEIRTAREILSSIADLKMDLGLNNRHLGTVGIDAHLTAHVEDKYHNSGVAAVLANPEKRRKLLGVASELMKRAGRQVIDAEAEIVEATAVEGNSSSPVSPGVPIPEPLSSSDSPEVPGEGVDTIEQAAE